MVLGFTGTRRGMTQRQRDAVRYLFRELPLTHLHHGGEAHADAEVHRDAKHLGAFVEVWPGPTSEHRDFHDADCVHPVKPNLDRDQDIAFFGYDGLIAAPAEKIEVLRSGTWATIRRARKLARKIWKVFPDGTVREEQNNA